MGTHGEANLVVAGADLSPRTSSVVYVKLAELANVVSRSMGRKMYSVHLFGLYL